mmetsp:Transcript_24382/g.33864  ORF Transcript_24382/g.33864 Transcript_24382/m.33864 type:complete len:359 (-) Transcript_24382:151-1227(-)
MESKTHPGVQEVQVDGLALLQIIKHCNESKGGATADGQLLGLEANGKLEVTNAFPTAENKADYDEFIKEMMQLLDKVNVDNNTVGWYRSAFIGEWITSNTIRVQYEFQNAIPESVVLVYDPHTTTKGNLGLKAYRLSSHFMAFYKKKDWSHINFARHKIDSGDIFEEIPMKVHNSHLIHAFLYEMQEQDGFSCEFDRLDLGGDAPFEANLKIMSNSIDELIQDQGKFKSSQKGVKRVRDQIQHQLAAVQQQMASIQQQKATVEEQLRKVREQKKEEETSGNEISKEEKLTKSKEEMEGKEEWLKKSKEELLKKPLPYLPRLDAYLTSHKIGHYSAKVKTMIGENMAKMFEIDALNSEL